MLNGSRRRDGATLGLVAVCVLVIIVIGVACFWLVKIMGGGRELANATDSGALNVAKYAIRNPSKDPVTDFPGNPDVATNFALLTDTNNKLNLLVYNRLVAQATLVALNAHDEATPDASESARKVWLALNTVGQALTKDLDSSQYMGNYYSQLATKNNVRMSGGNAIGLSDYQVSFLKKGGSTNIWIDPVVLGTISSGAIIPQNAGGAKSPSGKTYMAGYQPYIIRCDPYDLEFSGITVNPNDRPHLVSYADFFINKNDNFVSGKGNPAFPPQTLPPNGYQASGNTKESKTNMLAGAVACAIVSSMNVQYQLQIPYGYLQVVNGPEITPSPQQAMAATSDDIFSHSLAGGGIFVSRDEQWFCHGGDSNWGDLKRMPPRDALAKQMGMSDAQITAQLQALCMTNPAWQTSSTGPATYDPTTGLTTPGKTTYSANATMVQTALNLIKGTYDETEQMKKGDNFIGLWCVLNYERTGLGPAGALAFQWHWTQDIPSKVASMEDIRHSDGSRLSSPDELLNVNSTTDQPDKQCHWQDYTQGMPKADPCLKMLNAFRGGYSEQGSANPGPPNPLGPGYTNLEAFKAQVMLSRVECVNCNSASPPASASGMKWFEHGKSYPAPFVNSYNFGIVKSPYEYMQMIDQVSGGCAEKNTFDTVLQRVQQIEPALSSSDLKKALLSHSLQLGQTLYLYCDSNRQLVMSDQKPISLVPGTVADGAKSAKKVTCGSQYDPIGTLVNTSTGKGYKSKADDKLGSTDIGSDGGFPGWAWHDPAKAKCTDTATFTPSTGYNNLLGTLSFSNQCTGGGGFCTPN